MKVTRDICGMLEFVLHLLVSPLMFSNKIFVVNADTAQPAFICSKLTIETLEEGVKYVQS